MTTIRVLDSIMGSGKTSFVFDWLNKTHAEDVGHQFLYDKWRPRRFIVVVPLLSEVERYKSACPDLNFKDPQPVHNRKLYDLGRLIEGGENIVTTHALFQLLERTMYEKILANRYRYTLVIDEVLDCVDLYTDLKAADKAILFKHEMVYVEKETRRLRWNYTKHRDYPDTGRFGSVKKLCDIGSLVMMSEKMLIWEFPSEFLKCFTEVMVCTYLFYGSTFYSYLVAEGFKFWMKSVSNGKLVDWNPDATDAALKKELGKLVSIYQGSMNDIGEEGERKHPLSSTWYKKASAEDLKRLKSSTTTFFERVAHTHSKFNGWTAYSSVKPALSGKGYARGWIANNARATNNFIDKRAMAYLCNWFYHPVIKRYFEERGVEVNEDAYALSCMLQWLWRSRIRCLKAIHVFIPSERMRNLLIDWLLGRGVSVELSALPVQQSLAA